MNSLLSRKKLIKDDALAKRKLKNTDKKAFDGVLKFLQELGKALQFPIAVLPFAAILNRFGTLGITFSTIDGTAATITNEIGY